MLYRLAAQTGFRRHELRSLTPRSFDLDGNPPTVTVRAAYGKHRRDDLQPIPEALAALLRPWLASRPSVAPLFGNLTKHTAAMIRADLAAAATPSSTDGGTADFHALRHSYVTALAKSNAPVKVVQSLARHSTPALILGVYAHVGLFDQTGALEPCPIRARPLSDPRPPPCPRQGRIDP